MTSGLLSSDQLLRSLSDEDHAMLDGARGEAARIAMRIVLRMAEIQRAEKLINVSHVHIGGSIYTGEGSLSVVERFLKHSARFKVPTTVNAISVDRAHPMEEGAERDFISNANRLADALVQMGARPTFSCTPYVFPGGPRQGDDILWAESNAITYANSVLGARTNRHGDFFDICAAITGRVPFNGLHRDEERLGEVLFHVPEIANTDPTFFTVLGYLVGKTSGRQVPVIDGIKGTPSLEDLKNFSSTVATAGSVGLFHMVGVTPEATNLNQAFGGNKPLREVEISPQDLQRTWEELSSGTGDELQLVLLGSPHATLGDFVELASLVRGRTKNPDVSVKVTTSQFVENQARSQGLVEPLEKFGIQVSTDRCLCMMNEQLLPAGTEGVMTNSGKFAHYGPGLIRRGVYFGTTADCIDSAVTGRPLMRLPRWLV